MIPGQARRGRINADWVKEHVHDQPNTVFYACGPNELVEATEALLLNELGAPKEQIRTEKLGLRPSPIDVKAYPLWASHQRLGGRLIEFGGWEMPVQYTGIVDEHQTVRRAAGVFDISHMGEIFVSGPAALDFLNARLTNDLRKCGVGQGQYSIMCNERGRH